MGLYKFSIAAAASPSDIEAKITSVRGQGANIYLHSIVDIGNLNLSINNKNVTINYDLIGTKQNSLFNWYICDTVGYETIIILYNSGTESDSTFGLANYNRIYFNVKNQLVSNPKISVTLAAQFNVLRGRFDSYESDGSDDDVIMLTKCVYNDGSNIETGEAIVTDNLYVSTNLRSTSFKTIVKDEDNKQFINVGGIFYLPYSEEITYHSWSEKQWILPPGIVDYEWHPATVTILSDHRWWDTTGYDTWVESDWNDSSSSSFNKNVKDFSLKVTQNNPGFFGNSVLAKSFIGNEDNICRIIYFVLKSNINHDFLHINKVVSAGTNIQAIDEKSFIIIPSGLDKWIVSKNPYDYHVYAVKVINPVGTHATSGNVNQSYWIDSNFEKNFSNVFVRWDYSAGAVGLVNCDIKYFAIVEHDQTSEEIVKTSQLLMDKFDIH